MTIEKKVREIVRTAIDNSLSVNKTTEAILALIKPMSRERLIEIIDERLGDIYQSQYLTTVILAEWEKGLK